LNGITTSKLTIDSGVPERNCFRSYFIFTFYERFTFYVNCSVRLFADDCLLYRRVNNKSDSDLLQKDISYFGDMENWFANEI